MYTHLFTVFDSKVACYSAPFNCKSKGDALRSFADTANDEQSLISKHPEDFTIFHLGSFNPETAEFNLLETPLSLGVAIEFKNKEA